MNKYELLYKSYNNLAGIDEVGRGCLFGPVVAACVILPKDFDFTNIKDSKKLSKKKREQLYEYIIDNCICYSVSFIDNKVIDEINILEATKLAMKESISKLSVKPDYLLVDAVKLDIDIENTAIIKGDTLSYSIACASIIAKVERDNYVTSLAKEYPYYSLETNMGYGTKAHIEGIKSHGITKYHRITFAPVSEFVKRNVISFRE